MTYRLSHNLFPFVSKHTIHPVLYLPPESSEFPSWPQAIILPSLVEIISKNKGIPLSSAKCFIHLNFPFESSEIIVGNRLKKPPLPVVSCFQVKYILPFASIQAGPPLPSSCGPIS